MSFWIALLAVPLIVLLVRAVTRSQGRIHKVGLQPGYDVSRHEDLAGARQFGSAGNGGGDRGGDGEDGRSQGAIGVDARGDRLRVKLASLASGRPVLSSVLLTLLLALLLVAVWAILPLQGNADHAIAHWAIALPLLLLGGLVVWTWPPLAPGGAARVVRWALISGLLLFGLGWIIEGLGAFGYADDGLSRASDLVELHVIGNAMSTSAFVPLLAGVIMTVGVVIANRGGAAQSRFLWWFVVGASAAIIAFYAGALVFGY